MHANSVFTFLPLPPPTFPPHYSLLPASGEQEKTFPSFPSSADSLVQDFTGDPAVVVVIADQVAQNFLRKTTGKIKRRVMHSQEKW